MLIINPALIPLVPDVFVLRAALQAAVMLEHSITPPYLYALYSLHLKTDDKVHPNQEIADIIRSIVREEMLHMVLACNLLNAIGGHPVIDHPDFVPKYPGRLPGTGEGSPEVHLEPFSVSLVESVFMPIESADSPIDYPDPGSKSMTAKQTVGAFYRAIDAMIQEAEHAGQHIFTGNEGLQIHEGFPGIIAVKDAATASAAIEIIVEQGEGTAATPIDPTGDLAHYYRFAQIVHRHRLILNAAAGPYAPPSEKYIYGGAPILFDSAGVWPVPTDPKAEYYPVGSAARRAIDGFNYTYTALLKSLHGLANGHPESFSDAFGLMFSLQEQAMGMMSGNVPGGISIGPTFEYLAVNA